MKRHIALAGIIVIAGSALALAQGINRALSGAQFVQAAQSSTKDQKAKTAKAKGQKNHDGKSSEASKFSKEQILRVQKALRRFDYYDGPMDGKLNPDLRQAIKDFQEDEGLEKTGELDDETLKRILSLQEEDAGEEPLSEEPLRY